MGSDLKRLRELLGVLNDLVWPAREHPEAKSHEQQPGQRDRTLDPADTEAGRDYTKYVHSIVRVRDCFNPQANPQFGMSYMTCAAFGSPRMLVSCCKA
jgi:hypothetical protein